MGILLRVFVVHHRRRNFRHRWPALTFACLGLMMLLSGCVTTYTQAEAPDGTELTILRVGFAGGFKGHGADASFVGPSGARLTVGDLAEDISVDPEVAGAIAQGATEAVLHTIKRIGMPVP